MITYFASLVSPAPSRIGS